MPLTPMQRLAVAVGFRANDGADFVPAPGGGWLHVRVACRKNRPAVPMPIGYDPGADDNVTAAAVLLTLCLSPYQLARIARAEQAAELYARADRLREEADALINQAEELERP